jgi:hypothetical protein
VRMNTASEKVLRRRSARGPTFLYDLRFRRNTVRCVAKFGSLLGLHALHTPPPGVEHSSVALTNGVFNASNHDILLIAQDTRGGRRAVGAKLSYYVFDVREAQDAAVQFTWAQSRAYHSGSSDHLSDCTNEKVKATAGADPPGCALTNTARDSTLPSNLFSVFFAEAT